MTASIAQLVLLLSSPDAAERAQAAQNLAKTGPEAASAALALIKATADDDESVREWSTAALEELGPPAREDVGELAALLTNSSPDVAYWAASLIGRLGSDGATASDRLVKALTQHASKEVRQRAAWALGRIGPAASAAVKSLRTATGSDDPRLARLAAAALESIEEPA